MPSNLDQSTLNYRNRADGCAGRYPVAHVLTVRYGKAADTVPLQRQGTAGETRQILVNPFGIVAMEVMDVLLAIQVKHMRCTGASKAGDLAAVCRRDGASEARQVLVNSGGVVEVKLVDMCHGLQNRIPRHGCNSSQNQPRSDFSRSEPPYATTPRGLAAEPRHGRSISARETVRWSSESRELAAVAPRLAHIRSGRADLVFPVIDARIRAKHKSSPRFRAGRTGKESSMLLIDPVGPLAFVRFEGFDFVAGLLHRAGHEPTDRVLLPAHLVHDLDQRDAILPLEQRDDLGGLATPAYTLAFLFARGRFLGFGRVLSRRRLLGRLTLACPWRACPWRPLRQPWPSCRPSTSLVRRLCPSSVCSARSARTRFGGLLAAGGRRTVGNHFGLRRYQRNRRGSQGLHGGRAASYRTQLASATMARKNLETARQALRTGWRLQTSPSIHSSGSESSSPERNPVAESAPAIWFGSRPARKLSTV
jgi:hypothetical protein